MIFRIISVLTLGLALSGCGSVNPLNWFGPKDDVELVVLEPEEGWNALEAADYRGPVAQVTSLKIERASAGVLIRAVGLPPKLGYWDAELVAENGGEPVKGVMTYTFKIAPPPWRTSNARPAQREVTVAKYVSDITLADVRTIRVVGAKNSLSARR